LWYIDIQNNMEEINMPRKSQKAKLIFDEKQKEPSSIMR